jgi:4-amino-4-deoxy-L-arabinose transferase and related glycosyltransferases of PMT family
MNATVEVLPATPARPYLRLAATVFVATASLLVVSIYITCAWNLVVYPWDWSPDEGLYLDFARRLLDAPGSLYNDRGVPVPAMYGPLYPALLAPMVRLVHPLAAARALSLLCALLGALALATLIRRRAGWVWAAAGAALYLSIFDIASYFMLARMDSPLIALWLWSAVVLLPRELRAGADQLSRGRMAGGTALLLAAALVKPTALVHGLPLVLGWFLVDRRSAWRLIAALAVSGLAILALLQVATGGGFVQSMLAWRLHGREPGLLSKILTDFSLRSWPVLALALVSALAAGLAKARPYREPACLMLVGGLLILPVASKAGALWNYLLPLYAALVVAAGCWAARAVAGRNWQPVLPAAIAALSLALATTQVFPLPTTFDEAAARTLYGFVQDFHRKVGGPFLASSPDLVYFLVGEQTEIEGTSFSHLVDSGAPGALDVLTRLEQARYTLVVETWPLPAQRQWQAALQRNYRPLGVCRLGSYFTGYDSRLYARRGLPVDFTPPAGVRCLAVPRGH